MNKQELKEWIETLKQKTPGFLNELYKGNGFYKYSYCSDIYDNSYKWGLGNSVFALKIYNILGVEVPEQKKVIDYILSFSDNNGFFFDKHIKRKSLLRRMLSCIKRFDLKRLSYLPVKNAETRQVYCALKLNNANPVKPLEGIPCTVDKIDYYLNRLDWSKPWDAASHFSHLLFFLSVLDYPDKKQLIDHAIKVVNSMQDSNSGFWFKGNPSMREQINGAMKIFTAYNAVIQYAGINYEISVLYLKEIIDSVLMLLDGRHACDNFNAVYVLSNASSFIGTDYRKDEINRYFEKMLDVYKSNYYQDKGAFSFGNRASNMYYYGAKITRGEDCPDIHGTLMYLWGIAVISDYWKIENGLSKHTP